MLDEISVLQQTTVYQNKPPNSAQVVDALLKLEKKAKPKANDNCSLADLAQTWNLRFITGTRKTRKKAGVILGRGKYIPQLVKIQIAYEPQQQESNKGTVTNSVKLGLIQLSLTGPIEFIAQKRILAFDFTYLKFSVGKFILYQGHIKNGLQKEAEFWQQKIKDRAFFKYFLIKENVIAARGRGGGLALWVRD
ncbi:MAG: hypothetical protein AAFY63_22735 [Cyanobacteria bacterium J06643_13]